MAFRAILNFGGKELNVLDCSYKLRRNIDPRGCPASNIYGGVIKVHVESTEDTSILEGLVVQIRPNSGSITFKKGDYANKK